MHKLDVAITATAGPFYSEEFSAVPWGRIRNASNWGKVYAVFVDPPGAALITTIKLQGSMDGGTTWFDIHSVTDGAVPSDVALYYQMRFEVSVTGAPTGTATQTCYLEDA